MNRPRHIPELDGVRGVAIGAVLLFHAVYAAMFPLYGRPPASWHGTGIWLARMTEFGWAGVDLFFVLSGFLITGILVGSRDREDYYRRFFSRRARRILPLYFVVLLVLATAGYSLRFLGLCALGLANLTPLFHVPMFYLPLWSVALEMQFYLVWPPLVHRLSDGALRRLCLAVILLSPLIRAVGFGLHANTYAYTWFRLDGFAAGAWLALSAPEELPRLRTKAAALAIGLSVLTAGLGGFDRERLVGTSLIFSIWMLFSVVILSSALLANRRERRSLWRSKALTWLGLYSYGIYLIHPLVFLSWDALTGVTPDTLAKVIARAVVILALSLATSRIVFEAIERPALKEAR